MSLYELGGVELQVDLENTDLKDVGIGYHDFMRILDLDQYGGLPLNDFGGWFDIRKNGVYLKLPDERVLASLTALERDAILRHPKGRPDEPAFTFPVVLRELKFFLDWAESVGYDVPISEGALLEVIKAQMSQPILDVSSSAIVASQSDASLGAHYRQQNRDFAEKNHERHEARAVEHQRWRDVADEIQRTRKRPASLRELADLVKERLNLPDSKNTIRKRLGKQNWGSG